MEQLVVIAVFAVIAAVCVKILTVSYLMTAESVDTRYALAVAESAAERFKAGEYLEPTAHASYHVLATFYDDNWGYAESAEEAAFVLRVILRHTDEPVRIAEISVSKVAGGADEELVSLTAARRGG
jgi:hypothetical protein